jgi:2-desacetyl-2-hydroxyethyl bacteriochlorophyllide A dehydrogenase
MNRQALYFTAPLRVEVREETFLGPGPEQLLVQSIVSAISAGTELLFYRGLVPEELAVDETITALQGAARYPMKYGYACVGLVIGQGMHVSGDWVGRKVFCFNPHETHFCVSWTEVMVLPEGMPAEQAVFLPNMETALNFVLDGQPLIGEYVGVFGAGIVGLLTTALLRSFPLAGLAVFDRFALRRAAVLRLGVAWALDPADEAGWLAALAAWGKHDALDLAFEVSGAPAALDQAIERCGYAGRVLIGSWYGKKSVSLNLGGKFHRSRLRLISSQVSSIAPELSGRWDKQRRFGLAWEQLARIQPEGWISQRFALQDAAQAYQLLAERPDEAIQVVFTY